MKKITFKEYLESKEKLRQAISESPVYTATYSVKKYCKIPVGESKETKEYVALKPKQKVIVEWKYDDIDNPDIISLRFENVKDIATEELYEMFWTGTRLQKWLTTNTREES